MTKARLTEQELRTHRGISFTGVTTVFFCYDDQQRIFLAKRGSLARDEQGRWDPGAGGLEHGQTLVQNLRRELKEEYDIDEPKKIDFLGYHDVFRELDDGTPTHWLAMYFAVQVDPAQVRINEPHKVDEAGWFTLDKLPSPLHSQFNTFLELYGDELRRVMAAA